MIIPIYSPISKAQYSLLLSCEDGDDAVDLVMEWNEEDLDRQMDLDKEAGDLSRALEGSYAQKAVDGVKELCDDPGLFVASPEEVVALAQELQSVEVNGDVEGLREELAQFYSDAASQGMGMSVLYN